MKEDVMDSGLRYSKAAEEVMYESFRARIATAAMQAIIGNDTLREAKMEAAINLGETPHKIIAESAVKFADALIIELRKK